MSVVAVCDDGKILVFSYTFPWTFVVDTSDVQVFVSKKSEFNDVGSHIFCFCLSKTNRKIS